jgi:hypothetical protein
MIRWLLHKLIAGFERKTNYDAAYWHEITDVAPGAAARLLFLPVINRYQGDAPPALWYGAGIASMVDGDCGPCLQLMVDGALHEGVAPADVTALIAGNVDAAGEDARLGFLLGKAAIENQPEAVEYREQVLLRFGDKALIALAFVTSTARAYPVIKRVLGHGAACQKIRVGRAEAPVIRKAA